MLLFCVRFEPFCMLSRLLNRRSSAFERRVSLDLMVSGIRRKHVRRDRRSHPPEPDSDVALPSSGSDRDSSSSPMGFRVGFNESAQTPNLNPNFDDKTLDHYTDEQLNDFMLKKLALLYNEAISKLVSLGYDENVVIEAVLRNGHCHGNMDPFTNILHNTQTYLSIGDTGCKDELVNTKKVFDNPKQLIEASLISLVCLLRRNDPFMSRREAMCWLLVSNLHVIHPSSTKISNAQNPNEDGDDVNTQSDNQLPIWSEPPPSLLVLVKDYAASLAEELERLDGDASSEVEINSNVSLEVLNMKNKKFTKSILKQLNDLNLEKDKDDTLFSLMKEIMDVEIQVKERKKWADEKALQAIKRLCEDRNELKKLRMEREDNERIKQQKSTLDIDHPTMKSLIDVELALRTTSLQLDRALMIVTRLEVDNMDIRADIVALKLGTSESVAASVEAAKREKKHLKKILAWEKLRGKLQEDIASEKQKLMEMEDEVIQFEATRKTAEAKWRGEQETKKDALARVKHETCLKEQTMSDNKRIPESSRAKIDLNLKCHKDDIQRLEQELSWVKSLTDPDHYWTSLFGLHFEDDTIGRLLHGSGDEDDESDDEVDHGCVMCGDNKVSVVFLPCAHEVVCVGCSEELKKDECPTCGVAIEQRIRVYGGSS